MKKKRVVVTEAPVSQTTLWDVTAVRRLEDRDSRDSDVVEPDDVIKRLHGLLRTTERHVSDRKAAAVLEHVVSVAGRAMVADEDEDDRPVKPAWEELSHLVEAAEGRGWSPEQLDYLRSSIGIAYAKGVHKGRRLK